MIASASSHPIDAAVFRAANSRAYLAAVAAAWTEGLASAALPARIAAAEVPGLAVRRQADFRDDPGWYDTPFPDRPGDETGVVAFSSGTTGTPKAIVIPHRALDDVVARINAAMGTDAAIREYVGVPVTFSFGFGRVRAATGAGGAAYLPPNGFDPAEIGRMLSGGEINAISAVPTLWRVLLANRDALPGGAARRVRWIEIGSQWMTAEEKLALRQLFPEARIVQHYGLTEASRSALLDVSEAPQERLASVGRATGDVRLDIDEAGRIRVAGPHVARGLLTPEGLTPVAGEDGWLTTSDRGRLEDGWLYYEGRLDEIVNVGGLKIDPTAFEQQVNARLGVPGAVAAGRIPDPLRGERLLVALDTGAGVPRARAGEAARAVAEETGLTGQGGFELREVEALPLTATGKVRRAALPDLPDVSAVATAPASGEGAAAAEADPRVLELQRIWGEILGVPDVPADRTFYDLGGDSLSAMTAILRMEAAGIDAETARGLFDGRTIAEIAAGDLPPAGDGASAAAAGGGLSLAQSVNAIHATRGVLVAWVVIVHWFPAVLTRIGEGSLALYDALAPAWRFGTPGFAFVFGLGIGALRMHHWRDNPALFRRGLKVSTWLVLGGVILLGLIRLGLAASNGMLGQRIPMSGLFYSVLSYYALILLALPALVPLLFRGANRVLTILGFGVAAMILHEILEVWVAPLQPGAFLEFLKLLLTAKYGFFQMTFYVLLGVAVGWIFRARHGEPGIIRDLAGSGLLLVAFGGLGLWQASPDDLWGGFNAPHLWHLAIYLGVTLGILAGFAQRVRAGGGRLTAAAIATGIMALPIFVGHEIVFNFKQLLEAWGVPDAISLPMLLGGFVVLLAIGYRRLLRYL